MTTSSLDIATTRCGRDSTLPWAQQNFARCFFVKLVLVVMKITIRVGNTQELLTNITSWVHTQNELQAAKPFLNLQAMSSREITFHECCKWPENISLWNFVLLRTLWRVTCHLPSRQQGNFLSFQIIPIFIVSVERFEACVTCFYRGLSVGLTKQRQRAREFLVIWLSSSAWLLFTHSATASFNVLNECYSEGFTTPSSRVSS